MQSINGTFFIFVLNLTLALLMSRVVCPSCPGEETKVHRGYTILKGHAQ